MMGKNKNHTNTNCKPPKIRKIKSRSRGEFSESYQSKGMTKFLQERMKKTREKG